MQFLVDENLGKRFSNLLKQAGYDAIFAGDVIRGSDDEIVLANAEKERRILLTDDKDFGELIFRLKKASHGVILFRTSTQNPEKRFEILSNILDKNLEGKFVVLKEEGARIRKLG